MTGKYKYIADVLADLAAGVVLDNREPVMSGFSAAGMLTCTTSPASIAHIHGSKDTTVPGAGRVIWATKLGDVSQVLEMCERFGGTPSTPVQPARQLTCSASKA